MKVLIVDDSSAMRKLIKRIISKYASEVCEAENGQVALGVIQQHGDFDVVLIDWNMPVMDGLQLIKKLRRNEEYCNMKLVMVTTEAEPAKMARALISGADEFVMKPFTEEVMLEKLRLIGVQLVQAAN